jgi:hypothetical protein
MLLIVDSFCPGGLVYERCTTAQWADGENVVRKKQARKTYLRAKSGKAGILRSKGTEARLQQGEARRYSAAPRSS